MKEYILTSTVYHATTELIFYGIALIDTSRGACELVEEYNDISENKDSVEALVEFCNKTRLEESKLQEAVGELLT